MKTLKEFILESSDKKPMSKTIILDFEQFDDGKEKLEEIIANHNSLDFVTVEDNKMTITVTDTNINDVNELYNDLKAYCAALKNSPKRSSDEQYAQKIKKFTELVNSIENFKNEIEKSEEE